MVGKYDLGKAAVAWETVDGLPTRAEGTCADRAKDSWRNGESDSGDNVGLYTSIQISADGRPMVSRRPRRGASTPCSSKPPGTDALATTASPSWWRLPC